MKEEMEFYREQEWVFGLRAEKSATCNQCNSGEIYQPPQTESAPTVVNCLKCGRVHKWSDVK